MVSPPRLAAYRALLAVETGRADLPAALAQERATLHDERDRALAGEITTGTLRWQGKLDALIAHFAARPLSRLDLEVLIVLRLSGYQILHLSRVPTSAATHEAVMLVRQIRKTSAAGLVNAVLRSLSRARGRLPLPPMPGGEMVARITADPEARAAAIDYLSTTLSHPRWLAARWLDRHGFDAAVAWEQFNNTAAPLTLRANTLSTTVSALADRLHAAGVTTAPTTYAPDGLAVTEGNPLLTRVADTGDFFVQDEASQLVAVLAARHDGERTLDGCASPGGKTTAMAAASGDRGLIVAADVRPGRLALLRRTVERSRSHSVRLAQLDAGQPLPFRPGTFDLVLIDAPCSGLGTIRRDPEIRWRRQEADLARFAEAQRRMLHYAADVVRPGGRLIYATCSSEPEENDEVVASFLVEHRTFSIVDARRDHPPRGLAAVLDENGMLRTSPARHGLEAFFGVVLQAGTVPLPGSDDPCGLVVPS
jgi:16S rRNA (cytosine967-C5)-methyltransferase